MKKIVSILLVFSILYAIHPKLNADAPDKDLKICGPGCVVALVALAVGAVIVAELVHFCKKHLPRPRPYSPPPPPPDPPKTSTNQAPKALTSPQPVLSFSDEAIDMVDIETNLWLDTEGIPYRTYCATVLESSADMKNWKEEVEVSAWCSDSHVLSVISSNGIPCATNYAAIGEIMLPNVPKAGSGAKYFRLRLP